MIKKYFRPVSNIVFSGKLIEHIAADQIISHIDQYNLIEEKQSAYRRFHSTETALLEVKTDIIKAMDNQGITCLILLDLSAAFDTNDHTILLNRLETTFGISDTALKWIASYLTGWTPDCQMDKLQCIQNMACRVIFQLRKHDHITHHLKS